MKFLKLLIWQAQQMFNPFPQIGSWAYNLETWWYDLWIKPVIGDIDLDPLKEAEINESGYEIFSDPLDAPTYIRRGYSGSSHSSNDRITPESGSFDPPPDDVI